jgi:hypothetical protein
MLEGADFVGKNEQSAHLPWLEARLVKAVFPSIRNPARQKSEAALD